MTMINFNLLAEIKCGEYGYTVIIEEVQHGVARLIIAEVDESGPSQLQLNSQGVDLTSAECAALGKHLLNVSERLIVKTTK